MFKKDDPPQQPSKLSVLFASILVIGFFFVYLSDGTIINYYREFSFSEGVFYTFVALPVLFCFLLFFSFPYALFIYFLILSILNLFFDHKRIKSELDLFDIKVFFIMIAWALFVGLWFVTDSPWDPRAWIEIIAERLDKN